jgi:hypothetical protein
MYQWTLNTILYQMPQFGEFLCQNAMCKNQDCLANIQEYHDAIVDACIQSSKAAIPWTSPVRQNRRIPGWNEFVKEHRDRAIDAHRAWKAAGSPQQGDLFKQRKLTRKIYHEILKEIQADEERLRAERMAAKLTGSGIWSEVKGVLGTNKPRLPTTVGDAQGDDAIADVFQKKYHDLYNSVPYDSEELKSICEIIDQRITQLDATGADYFTGAGVERAVKN